MELNPFLFMNLERSCTPPLKRIWHLSMHPITPGKPVHLRKTLDKIFIWISVGHITLFKCFISSEPDKKMLWSVPYDRNKAVCYATVKLIIAEEPNCGKNVGVPWFWSAFQIRSHSLKQTLEELNVMLFKVQNQHYVTLVTFVIGLRSSRVNNFTCLASYWHYTVNWYHFQFEAFWNRMHTVLPMCVCLSVLLSVHNKIFCRIYLSNYSFQVFEFLTHFV